MAKKHQTIPLSGKYMTHDPATIGANFQTLTNMRYDDTHPKGVSGNTKINSTALSSYPKVRNAFHFLKHQPSESHILVQAKNSDETEAVVLENTSTIPNTGDFNATALWTDSSGASTGYFADCSDGQIVYCNSVDTCIWGGNEMPPAAFITSTAAIGEDGSVTNPRDDSDRMQNAKSDGSNLSYIGGGYDSYAKFLWSCNGSDGDTSEQTATSGQTVTLHNGAHIKSSYKKFGTAGFYCDGTDDYASVPDSDDWYFGANPFTIDFWFQPLRIENDEGLFGQYVDADNYWSLFCWVYNTEDGAGEILLKFTVKSDGSIKAQYKFSGNVSSIYSMIHIELCRTPDNDVNLYVNGTAASKTTYTAISTNEIPNLAAVLTIGSSRGGSSTAYANGVFDEIRISKGICRHTSDFTPPTEPYKPDARYVLIGSTRPIQGVKWYVHSANSISSTFTGSVWTGSTWQSLTLTDNTSSGGVTLAQTGTTTFYSTVSTAKPRFIEGYYLYWTQFYLSAGAATLYSITIDAPFQPIVDLWDGVYRDIMSAYKMGATSREDVTTKILKDDYDSSSSETYLNLSSLDAYPTSYLEFGFEERVTGLHFRMPSDYTNSNNTVMSVDYWNGFEFQSVGTVTDGTADTTGEKSMNRSGSVVWNNADITDEVKSNRLGSATIWSPLSDTSTTESIWGWLKVKGTYVSKPLYWYRVRFSAALDSSVRLNYVGGISCARNISHYKFPIFAQGRILLCTDMSGERNKVTCSAKWMPHVYNGKDSVDVYIGDDTELTCGTELFSQYGGNLYSLILLFKQTEFWIIAGQDIAEWEHSIFPISRSIGCPAPLTLKTISLPVEPQLGMNRTVAIWQGTNGIYMSDGRAPVPIHGDIKEYFDATDSRCINSSKISSSVSFIDAQRMEYHWLFASGSSTTLDKELVYDIKRNKWFEINRGTGMYLQCGVGVRDSYGNQYCYGFIDTGYMERLENGTTFDGNNITCTLRTGDYLPNNNIMSETMIDRIKVITKAKITTTNNITVVHYGDSSTSGTTLKDCFDPTHTNYRLAFPFNTDNLGGYTFHSLQLSMTTNNEAIPFEPIAIGIAYHDVREG